jgi:hypothetical protein
LLDEVEVGAGELVAGGVEVGGSEVAVGVRVLVGEEVGGNRVAVGVRVLVGVEVAGGWVLVGGEPVVVSTKSWGAWLPDSRAERLMAVEFVVKTAKLNNPLPCKEEVISTSTQLAALTGVETPRTLPMAGALL